MYMYCSCEMYAHACKTKSEERNMLTRVGVGVMIRPAVECLFLISYECVQSTDSDVW